MYLIGDAEKQKMTRVYAAIDSIDDADALRNKLRQILYEGATPAQKIGINNQLAAMTSPWYIHFVRYNPAADLQQVRCPVFALFGKHDVQVSAELNSQALEQNYRGKKLQLKIYPQHNHLMQKCSAPGLEYGKIEQTIDPAVLSDIAEWIAKR